MFQRDACMAGAFVLVMLLGCGDGGGANTGADAAAGEDLSGADLAGDMAPLLDAEAEETAQGAIDTASGDTDVACVPACEDRECGDDGCGGSCGHCLGYQVCSENCAYMDDPHHCILQGDCLHGCLDECPDGWTCQYVDVEIDPMAVCVPEGVDLCLPCDTDSDCTTIHHIKPAHCVPLHENQKICMAECWPYYFFGFGDARCVNGSGCQQVPLDSGEQASICVPDEEACPCQPDCQGKQCGPDGCGGSCGTCDQGSPCCGGKCLACSCEEYCNEWGCCEPTESGCTPEGEWICNCQVPEAEACDGIDNNCDGETDEGFFDYDLDGQANCVDPDDDSDGDLDATDCDPLNSSIFHGAGEACDCLDNNCNGKTDEGFPDMNGDGCCDVDDDIDGDGDPDVMDCAPWNPKIFHGALETCDGMDNNCNAQVDDGYPDTDQDGLADCVDPDDDNDGDPDETDCAPWDSNVHHKATEQCNGLDDDCDGEVDEDCQ